MICVKELLVLQWGQMEVAAVLPACMVVWSTLSKGKPSGHLTAALLTCRAQQTTLQKGDHGWQPAVSSAQAGRTHRHMPTALDQHLMSG